MNSGRSGGGSTVARLAFRYLLLPEGDANEGTFRPLKLILPEGTIVSARPTAPMGAYNSALPLLIDLGDPRAGAGAAGSGGGGALRHLLDARLCRTTIPTPARSGNATTAVSAAGARCATWTAADRSAPCATATRGSFRSSCTRRAIRS